MQDFGTWEPALDMPIHFVPVDPSFLAPPPQGTEPVTANLGAEGVQTADVGGDGVVREVPSQHVREPGSLHGDRQVLSDTDFAFDGLQLGTLSFGDGTGARRNNILPPSC
jgi:hypothetical protein